MKVYVVHDSKLGNGRQIAETMQQAFEALGHTVTVGHVKEIYPATAVDEQTDLLVVGAAIRGFMNSPATSRWLRGLNRSLRRRGTTIDRGAVFLTHALSKNAAERWGKALRKRMSKVDGIRSVHPVWLSGRVVEQEGPLEDGTLERFAEYANQLAGSAVITE